MLREVGAQFGVKGNFLFIFSIKPSTIIGVFIFAAII